MAKFIPKIKTIVISNSERLERSYTLSRVGQFDDAIAELKIVLHSNPRSFYAYLALGNIYFLQKSYGEALRCFQKTIELDPLTVEGFIKVGQVYLKLGHLDWAYEEFQSAINLDPKSVPAFLGIGRIFMQRTDYDRAEKIFQYALTMNPETIFIYLLLAEIYRKQQRWEEAVDKLQTVLKIQPRLAIAYGQLGRIYLEMRRYDRARTMFEEALQLNPFFIPSQLGFVETLIQSNELKAAAEFIEMLPDLYDPNSNTNANLRQIEQTKTAKDTPFDETHNFQQLWYVYAWLEQEPFLSNE